MIVDRRFQFRLVRRLILHWLCFISAVMTLLVGWHLIVNAALEPTLLRPQIQDILLRYAPVLIALWATLPLLVWDVLKISHSVIGPIVRLRGVVRALRRGEQVAPVILRRSDHCTELADELNLLIKELNNRFETNSRLYDLLAVLPEGEELPTDPEIPVNS